MAKEKKEILDQMLKSIFSGARVVVLTGAGVSTASGISDFRGENGLYTSGIDAEEILSRKYFRENPELFYQFYTQNMMIEGYEPNLIHQTLAALEKAGYIDGIITQNIDKLHQKAGSKNVVEIHGDGSKYYCTKCEKEYSGEEYLKNKYHIRTIDALINF